MRFQQMESSRPTGTRLRRFVRVFLRDLPSRLVLLYFHYTLLEFYLPRYISVHVTEQKPEGRNADLRATSESLSCAAVPSTILIGRISTISLGNPSRTFLASSSSPLAMQIVLYLIWGCLGTQSLISVKRFRFSGYSQPSQASPDAPDRISGSLDWR